MVQAVALTLLLATIATTDPAQVEERAITCGATPALVAAMLEVEARAGVPERYVGMSLAAACRESRFSPRVIAGLKRGDAGAASGIVQVHGWAEDWCGLERHPLACGVGYTDPVALTECWLARILATRWKATGVGAPASMRVARGEPAACPRPFLAAWAFVAAGPKGYRCRAPRHWGLLRRWRR